MVDLEPFKEWVVEEDNPEQGDWKKELTRGKCSGEKIGNYFIKHHKWGKPKLRLVWADEGLTTINWGEPKESTASSKVKGAMKIREITEIREGLVNSKISDKKAAVRTACSFSLLAKGRTLELECPTTVESSRRTICRRRS